MYTKTTGSLSNTKSPDGVVGSLHFLNNGYLEISMPDSPLISELDKSLFFLAADFSAYAFNRKDWMEEFLLTYNPKESNQKTKKKESKPGLTLIMGGLKDTEED